MPSIFPTAQDAENAFYDALESADLDAMMAVWADDEEIVCVHPGWPRLAGQDQVREGWRRIFSDSPKMRVQVSQQVAVTAVMVAVHSVHESITLAGETGAQAPVVATNVYLRTAAGWRMVAHHGSVVPGEAQVPHDAPQTLH
ncbi:MAG TPA: nuclear transport factor 2 family protein [Burkholderiales bacterium]|nr:nuclear transport factor 2 family protein [Burkholderiales bacterium]